MKIMTKGSELSRPERGRSGNLSLSSPLMAIRRYMQDARQNGEGPERGRWNAYLVGALIGILSMVTFAVADKPIGMSTAVAQASGACALPWLGAEGVAANTYWAKKAVPTWDYGALFLAGSFLGALASALVSGTFRCSVTTPLWRERFGPSIPKRLMAAFFGGAIALFGARLADGCTSGHGISGALQLAVGSWAFFLSMFASGVVAARLIFGKKSSTPDNP
jgi:uncharacterized protein